MGGRGCGRLLEGALAGSDLRALGVRRLCKRAGTFISSCDLRRHDVGRETTPYFMVALSMNRIERRGDGTDHDDLSCACGALHGSAANLREGVA
jgi:hypothetical protein